MIYFLFINKYMTYQEGTLRNAYISLTKFIDTLIDKEVVTENDELDLVFSNWRTNKNFSNRWTIEHPHYYIRRNADMRNIDKEVKKVLPTVKFIDFPVNKSLNPSMIKTGIATIKVYTKKKPLKGNSRYYYRAEMKN